MRLIDADVLLERIKNPYQYREVARWVNDMPTIEPKKGKWIPVNIRFVVGARCSLCQSLNSLHTTYCPWCGADMREEQ